MSIAIIGTGNMGAAMAEGLLAAGHEVLVYNRTRSRAEPLQAKGARIAETAEAAIMAADLTILVLFDGASTSEVLFSPAVLPVLPGKRLINVSATMPEEIIALSQRAAEAGADLAEINVTVYPDLVRDRTGHFIVASSPETASVWTALFADLGSKVHHVGAIGNASRAELALWFSYMFHTLAAAYSAAAATKLGLPQDVVISSLTENPTLRIASADTMLPQMFQRAYKQELWSIDNFVLSTDMIIDFGRSLNLPTGILEEVRTAYARAQERGFGAFDVAAVFEGLV